LTVVADKGLLLESSNINISGTTQQNTHQFSLPQTGMITTCHLQSYRNDQDKVEERSLNSTKDSKEIQTIIMSLLSNNRGFSPPGNKLSTLEDTHCPYLANATPLTYLPMSIDLGNAFG
jgi:hypothetical protein